MPYDYTIHKPDLNQLDDLRTFLAIREHIKEILDVRDTVTMAEAMRGQTGDVWALMGHVDHLVELGEIFELTRGSPVFAQDRVFTR